MDAGTRTRPLRRRPAKHTTTDALVIGAGFYGCEIALELRRLGFQRVTLVEREAGILRRASFVNQARVHNGYHYPRSQATAVRSRENMGRFLADYGYAVDRSFQKVYAIAVGSRVSASQFESFCASIGAFCRPAPTQLRRLFDSSMIEECFLTQEYAFDARKLAADLSTRLRDADVDLRLGTTASVLGSDDIGVDVMAGGHRERASYVFNCTYGALQTVGIDIRSEIKRELTEMILIEPPSALRDVGVTVMDGPYFSTMPFPAAALHSLSHVTFTPHGAIENGTEAMPTSSNGAAMLRDASRFMPALNGVKIARSLFEIKTVLRRNETDDGRPILIEVAEDNPRILSILGAKIDTVFDALEFIRARSWS